MYQLPGALQADGGVCICGIILSKCVHQPILGNASHYTEQLPAAICLKGGEIRQLTLIIWRNKMSMYIAYASLGKGRGAPSVV